MTFACLELDLDGLDPTHQRKLDVGVPGLEAIAWLRPCNAQFYCWGTPCDCQEGDCNEI